jgi:hypothetical protein
VTGHHFAMDPQVTTTLLSGGVALTAAVIGIVGAVWAQLVATRRAARNSLALFERQHAAEDARRFAEERQATYAKFLRVADEYVAAANETHRYRNFECDHRPGSEMGEVYRKAAEHYADVMDTTALQLRQAVTQVELVGSEQVRAATKLLVDRATGYWPLSYRKDRAVFLEAARRELGVDAGD